MRSLKKEFFGSWTWFLLLLLLVFSVEQAPIHVHNTVSSELKSSYFIASAVAYCQTIIGY